VVHYFREILKQQRTSIICWLWELHDCCSKSAAWILKSTVLSFFKSAMWLSNQPGGFENPPPGFTIRHVTSLYVCHVAFQIRQVASQISQVDSKTRHTELPMTMTAKLRA
jgi:hypothetical protein